MSYYSSLQRTLVMDEGSQSVNWPAEIELIATLSPSELFESPDIDAPRIVISGETEFEIDGRSGKMKVIRAKELLPVVFNAVFPDGEIKIVGKKAIIRLKALSVQHVHSAVDFLCLSLAQFLSIQIGIFVDVKSITGTLAGKNIDAFYPGGSYSALVSNLTEESRLACIQLALEGPNQECSSYPRFVVSSFYYHHALRLMSPHEVNYIPYVVHSEVMLNLTKSLEILFATTDRDALRAHFAALGYSSIQVESQLIPIFLMRNESDVAHPTASRAGPEIIAIYRQYIDRSILNVGSVLRRVVDRIKKQNDLLAPLENDSIKNRQKFAEKLRDYLQDEALEPNPSIARILATN